jgi:hypothetical protein
VLLWPANSCRPRGSHALIRIRAVAFSPVDPRSVHAG